MVNVLIECDILTYNFLNGINGHFPMASIYLFIYLTNFESCF